MRFLRLLMTKLLLTIMVLATINSAPSPSSNLKLSVAARRNETGHWILQADVFSAVSKLQIQRSREVVLDVDHRSVQSSDTDTVHLTAIATMSSEVPPDDYELFPGLGFYKFHLTGLAWEDAQSACVREGTHLLVINSDAEANVVKEFFIRKPNIVDSPEPGHIAVGIHDRYEEGKWITVQGQPLGDTGYTRWFGAEPNSGTLENCGACGTEATYWDSGCSTKLAFICEWD